ncbi:MAG TPA: FMN-binding negative transcriptional regulator [Gemmatimonadaceae bacterium]|nr:FMN-binding negative transcriptional regulator [Gemmatimonadaceae bacterium]
MYNPPSFAEHDVAVMHAFIDAHPLGALVTSSPTGLFATHLPLILDRSREGLGTLQGHIARANPHHERAADGCDALVLFTGADAYVTPSLYPSKTRHGKVVPTWNYVAVHAHGTLRFVTEPTALRRHLERLTARHEAGRARPWSIDDTPDGYVDKLLGAIVGVEVEITRLDGKWKMSQNRPDEDVDGVIEGLGGSPDAREREVAALVRDRRPATRD